MRRYGLVDIPDLPSDIGAVPVPANGVISGGIVTWTGTGLIFNVSSCEYYINSIRYTSPNTIVTLASADPTYDRIDVFAVNTSNQVVVIQGTPALNPIEPEGDTLTTLGLTNVTIAAGATTPTAATRNLIYDENVESWTQTITGGTGFSYNAADTTQFYTGSKSFKVIQGTQFAQMRFSKAVAMDIRDYKSLSFALRLNTSWTTQQFQISFFNGSTRTAQYSFSSTNVVGFNSNLLNQWQFITINLALFNFSSNAFTAVQIYSSSRNITYWLDTISLNGGINNPGGTSTNSFGFVNGDTGSAIATVPTDTLNIVGTGLATTSATGKTLTIAVPSPIPSQTGNNGKYLTTDGSVLSWGNAQQQLNGTGFVKASGTTISYDNSTYITGNQTITLSGAVTGSGATSIATTLANSVVGVSNLSATGTPSATTYLRGDNTWATITTGSNIYNADGTLTGNRTLTMGGFNLSFVGSSFTNRFTSSGRLLLGTTTESTFLLDVNGTARATGTITTNQGLIIDRGSSPYIQFQNNGVTWGYVRATASNNIVINNSSNNQIALFDSNGLTLGSPTINTYRINVQSPNNITPAFFFERYVLSTSNAFSEIGRLQLTASTIEMTDDYGPYLSFFARDVSAVNNEQGRIGAARSGADNSASLVFYTSNAGTVAERWRISNSGVLTNNSSPNASAVLQADSTTKGFLPPRMTTTQKNAIGTPAAGLIVYDTTTNKLCCYDGTAWNDLF